MGQVSDGFYRKIMRLSITAANGFAEMELGKDSRKWKMDISITELVK